MANRRSKSRDRKTIENDYKTSKRKPRKNDSVNRQTVRMVAQSEIGGQPNEAERLVSQISAMRISHVQPKRSASKILSQQEKAACCRHNPERNAKVTQPGIFKSTELEKRRIRHFKDPYKNKKAAAPQQD